MGDGDDPTRARPIALRVEAISGDDAAKLFAAAEDAARRGPRRPGGPGMRMGARTPMAEKIDPTRFDQDERDLLLYCEDRAVNCEARLRPDNLTGDDLVLLRIWDDAGFVRHGRIAPRDTAAAPEAPWWVELSDAAWEAAARFRRERGERVWRNRTFEKAGIGEG